MTTNPSLERVIDSLQDLEIAMVKVNHDNNNGISYYYQNITG